jgi:hypothetical protein
MQYLALHFFEKVLDPTARLVGKIDDNVVPSSYSIASKIIQETILRESWEIPELHLPEAMRLQALGVIDIDKTNKIITFGAPLLQSVAMNRFNA